MPNYFPVVTEAFNLRDPVALVERVGDCAISAPFFGAGTVLEAVTECFPFCSGSLSSPTVRPGKPAAFRFFDAPQLAAGWFISKAVKTGIGRDLPLYF